MLPRPLVEGSLNIPLLRRQTETRAAVLTGTPQALGARKPKVALLPRLHAETLTSRFFTETHDNISAGRCGEAACELDGRGWIELP